MVELGSMFWSYWFYYGWIGKINLSSGQFSFKILFSLMWHKLLEILYVGQLLRQF